MEKNYPSKHLPQNAIVQKDPFEQDIRTSLNLGHTIGHVLERACVDETKTLCTNQPMENVFALEFVRMRFMIERGFCDTSILRHFENWQCNTTCSQI